MKHLFIFFSLLAISIGVVSHAEAQSKPSAYQLESQTQMPIRSTDGVTSIISGLVKPNPGLQSQASQAHIIVTKSAQGARVAAQTTETFTYSGRIVTFTVPTSVTALTIEARGAEGGRTSEDIYTPGKGAIITGTVIVTPGQQLSILVGGQARGGGGGSFVVTGSNPVQALVIAGGGGGGGGGSSINTQNLDSDSKQGQAGTSGGAGSGISGGTNGSGGTSTSEDAGAGGGLYTNGGDGFFATGGGKAFINGGQGGLGGTGGFGGGGTNYTYVTNGVVVGGVGGGGGGYSGGGGGNGNLSKGGAGVGGGGGSYNAGTNPISLTGAVNGNSGNGLVIISYTPFCEAFTATLSSSGTLTCAQTVVKLTAGGGLDGATYQFSSQPSPISSSTVNVTNSGPYSVTVTNPGGCSSTATTTVMSSTSAPMVSITPSVTAICAGQTATFTASGSPASYRWSSGQTSAMISATAQGPYSVTAISTTNGCSNTAIASLTVNPLPNPAIVGLSSAYCKDATAVPLTGSPTGGVFTVDGATATSFNPASLSIGQHTVVYSYTNANGCSATASQMVTVKEVPQTPTITTQPGGSYPANVSSLTISQNTGNVILGVSGCAGGTITWSGGNSNTLSVSTTNTGVQTFTATCTSNGCTSPLATATVNVVAPTLRVFSRDPDNGQLGNNTIKPYLQLQNVGTTPINYSTITVRYWLTTENNIPLIFQKNYVQIGQGNVQIQYVPLATPRQGATGYIEYSFSAGAGSLAPGGNSGPIETQINKQNYSAFNQLDDYSYVNNSAFTLNPRITAYENGVIFYGMEPGPVGASPRQGVPEAVSVLQVRVLGNPVAGQSAQVEISGVEGQSVQVELTDLQGRGLHQQRIEQAHVIERVSVPMGSSPGILLLQVSTPTQHQQIKLLKP